ncbi:MAG: hypothetical protein C4560_02875 [Nitrospiraceae bacterium]|nr:MAG: hypothetical protein C4560_02875 [Nitrospiraceae bacterium]
MLKIVLCFLLVSVLSVTAYSEDVSVSRVDYKVIQQSDYYIQVSFKVDVRNSGPAGDVTIKLHGVDAQGFEILTHIIIEPFEAGEYKTLSENRTFSLEQWNMVSKWEVKSFHKRAKR